MCFAAEISTMISKPLKTILPRMNPGLIRSQEKAFRNILPSVWIFYPKKKKRISGTSSVISSQAISTMTPMRPPMWL